jgi:hypothetical protein
MPRRVYTYSAEMGWGTLNLISTLGAFTIAASVLLFVINAVTSLRRGTPASANPWGAGTLEWATASPPPSCNFVELPVVRARDPLWDPAAEPGSPRRVQGLAEDTREVLVTTLMEARPDHRMASPAPTPWPFWSAVATAVMFVGSIFTPWAVVWGSIPIAIAVIAWFWPTRAETRKSLEREKQPALP